MLPVRTFDAPVVNTVPVSSPNVIVLSAVGSVTVKVVSFELGVAPSNTIDAPVDVIVPTVILPAANVPVVVRFSLPNEIAPELSVIDPAAIVAVPKFTCCP